MIRGVTSLITVVKRWTWIFPFGGKAKIAIHGGKQLHDLVTSRTSEYGSLIYMPQTVWWNGRHWWFFHSLDCYLLFTNWPEDKKYSALKGMLRDQADRWLQRQDLDELDTYDILKDAVQQQYRPQPAMHFPIQQKLLNRKQATSQLMHMLMIIDSSVLNLSLPTNDSIMHQFIRPWSHRSIRYTVFTTHYMICSPPQTRFRSFHASSLECRLWRRANRIA